MTIHEMQQQAYALAEDKGLHTDLREEEPRQATLVRLALMHTEVTEALNELTEPLLALMHLLMLHRQISQATQIVKKQLLPEARDAFAAELADIVIRTGDLAGCVGVDLQQAIVKKMAFNATRPYQFGTPGEQRP